VYLGLFVATAEVENIRLITMMQQVTHVQVHVVERNISIVIAGIYILCSAFILVRLAWLIRQST
jgi:hypothetical protein